MAAAFLHVEQVSGCPHKIVAGSACAAFGGRNRHGHRNGLAPLPRHYGTEGVTAPHYESHGPMAQDAQKREPFHVSRFADGTCAIEFHRTAEGYLLRFPGLADFAVSANGERISSWPAPGIGAATVEHLYLNQVLPLALGRGGEFVFHASAVEIDGGAVAFLGEAGRGKSTLAAAFATRGMRFLTDDGLVLQTMEEGFSVRPSHPSIRLWQDSHKSLFAAGSSCAPPVGYTSKARLLLGDPFTYCDEPRPLRAAYHLGERTQENIAIHEIEPPRRLMLWASHAFLIDVEDHALLSVHFSRTADLASAVPCFRIDYPRQFETLDSVISHIAAHARSLRSM